MCFFLFLYCEKATRWGIFAAAMMGPGDPDDNRQWVRSKKRSGDCSVSHCSLKLSTPRASACQRKLERMQNWQLSNRAVPSHKRPTGEVLCGFYQRNRKSEHKWIWPLVLYCISNTEALSKTSNITYLVKRKSPVCNGICLQIPDSSRLGNLSATVYIHIKGHFCTRIDVMQIKNEEIHRVCTPFSLSRFVFAR